MSAARKLPVLIDLSVLKQGERGAMLALLRKLLVLDARKVMAVSGLAETGDS